MACASEILGDRWTLLILREAFYGVIRYEDMRLDLGAPRSMLSDRLSKMVENGLMARHSYQDPGKRARNAYVLTPIGRDLALTFMALSQWGEKHFLKGDAPVELIDKETGKPLRVGLIDSEGRSISPRQAQLHIKP